MKFKSINPFNGEELSEYPEQSESEVSSLLDKAHTVFPLWRNTPVQERSKLLMEAGKVLKRNVEDYSRTMTMEMGKPITEARAEINKCASVCEYYGTNAERFLSTEVIETEAENSFVRQDPIGCVLAIMPWNFPFWQVFRFAAPALTGGNIALLKHAPNVFGCALQIEEVFKEAGFPTGTLQNLILHHDKIERVIASDVIKSVTLTGSERAGAGVAQIAGKYIKKTVLELGGNNAFIVWKDADIAGAVKTALTARMLNCGQSCIAAKRFLLVKEIHDEFVEKFTQAVGNLKSGNPLDETTQVGPLARRDLADQLHRQVESSIHAGAKLIVGGKQEGCYHEPTVLENVKPGMAAFDEETFGPLAAMVEVEDEEEAFALSEQSRYGLGVSVCTRDIERAVSFADRVSDGAYFINELVKSDPRLPFGGTKKSGYGRELARDGMMEFMNRKTVYVAKSVP